MSVRWLGRAVGAAALLAVVGGAGVARADVVRAREIEHLHGCVTWVMGTAPDPAHRVAGDEYVEDQLCISGERDAAGGVATDLRSDTAYRNRSTCTWRAGEPGTGQTPYGQCESTSVAGTVDGDTIRVSEDDERVVVIRGFAHGCTIDVAFGPRLGADEPPSDPAPPVDVRSENWSESGPASVTGRACDVDLDPLSPQGYLSRHHSHTDVVTS